MWAALVGFLLMVLAGVTSYKKARAKMSYETWWMVHVLTYGAVAASFMHQIANGQVRGRPSLTGVSVESPQLKVRVPLKLKKAIDKEAKRRGLTASMVVREALQEKFAQTS